jgi:hypothetical protein
MSLTAHAPSNSNSTGDVRGAGMIGEGIALMYDNERQAHYVTTGRGCSEADAESTLDSHRAHRPGRAART